MRREDLMECEARIIIWEWADTGLAPHTLKIPANICEVEVICDPEF